MNDVTTVERSAPASLGQRLLGLMEHYRGGESPLAVPVFYRLAGPLDHTALRAALDALVDRHEALRTTYETSRRRLVQHVHEPRPVPLESLRTDGTPAALEGVMRDLVRTPFDLGVSPVRATLLEVAPEESVLMLNIHHLSTDGWSGGVLAGDLGRLYRPGGSAVVPRPERPPMQYMDFSEWQRDRFESGALTGQQEFWRSRLAGAQPPALVGRPTGRADGAQRPGTHTFDLPESAAASLAEICRSQRTTTFAAGLAVFTSVLHTYTGDTDFGLASMFANRLRPELADTVGFLTNLLVLRVKMPQRPTFEDVLEATQDIVFDALGNQEIPYHLVPQAQGERGAGLENILFQVMAGPEYQLSLDGLEVSQLAPPDGSGSRFDLEFALIPERAGVQGIVWYDQRRFESSWVRRLVDDFARMAVHVAEHPDRPVGEGGRR
ncbi:condensation domain-containing protein [Streptomyces sp. NBC_01006]|uniref:condensation domain-containing protein n=1 Tax=Streptomyces sp. NBC_01006 TaxID=2903716 RepID=UPI00386DD8E8|nr:condensation domain-containing protein [Streptomyces sp. NBC_01006]